MPSFAVTVEADASRAEEIASDLFDLGAGGVEVRDGEGIPMPGVPQPPPGKALLVASFAGREAASAAAGALGGVIARIEDRDWSEEWKRGLGPVDVGRVRIRPTWVAAPPPPGSVEIVLDPGMAFGTGTHPTTSLCLGALSDLLESRPRASVLDVGTGSGLLAIAARKLGAGRVAANDVDPVAVEVARENAARNGASLELAATPVESIPGTFDLVVANILANTLVELAPALVSRLAPSGVLLLSGILSPQEDEVRRAYLGLGLVAHPSGDRRDGEWTLLVLGKPR